MSEYAIENLKQETEREVSEAQVAHSEYLSALAETAAARRPDQPASAATAAGATGEPAMVVLTDASLPDDTRVEVIRRLASSLSRQDDYIRALLRIVQDSHDSPAVREAALELLDSAAFQVLRFRKHREAYERALRNLVADPVPALRETAVTNLALQHDPDVQQTLQEGLRGTGPLPVERERAIQLLAEDDHLDNVPWLEELYGNGSDDARQEAVRLMGSYPAARATLEGILRDKGESSEVRQQTAASLRYLAPDRFEAIAKEIATDPTDHPDVRTASLTALQHLGDTDRVYADTNFLQRVQETGRDESAPQVARAARSLVERRRDDDRA